MCVKVKWFQNNPITSLAKIGDIGLSWCLKIDKVLHRYFQKLEFLRDPGPPETLKSLTTNMNKCFLAHLSRRLIGELIGYSWSGVRRRPSFTMLKHLLRNRLANQSQILCGASLDRGNESLFAASGSHDQDGRHAHIW